MMGIADSSSSTMILDRVFDSISVRPEGISFLEFARYVNVLFNGDQAAKAILCFRMIDSKKKGVLSLQDFTTLILTAILTTHGVRGGRKMDYELKAAAMAECIFVKFRKENGGTVSLNEFVSAVEEDPSLLEVFTLLSKGVTEAIIQPNEEDAQIKWYHGQAKFIYLCAKGILKDFMEENGFSRQGAFDFAPSRQEAGDLVNKTEKLSNSWYKPMIDHNGVMENLDKRKYQSDFSNPQPLSMNSSDIKQKSVTARPEGPNLKQKSLRSSEAEVRLLPLMVGERQQDDTRVKERRGTHEVAGLQDSKPSVTYYKGFKPVGQNSVGDHKAKSIRPIQLLHENTDYLMRELEDKLDHYKPREKRTSLGEPTDPIPADAFRLDKSAQKQSPSVVQNNLLAEGEERELLLTAQPNEVDLPQGKMRLAASPPRGTSKTDQLITIENSPHHLVANGIGIQRTSDSQPHTGDFSFANIPAGLVRDRIVRNTPFDTPVTPQLIGVILQENQEKLIKTADHEFKWTNSAQSLMQGSRIADQGTHQQGWQSTAAGAGLSSHIEAADFITLGGRLPADPKQAGEGGPIDHSNVVVMIKSRPPRDDSNLDQASRLSPADSDRVSALNSAKEFENSHKLPMPRILEENSMATIKVEGMRNKGVYLTKANQKVEEMFRQLEHDQSSAFTPIDANTPKAQDEVRSNAVRKKAVGWTDEAEGRQAHNRSRPPRMELGKSDESIQLQAESHSPIDVDLHKRHLYGSSRAVSDLFDPNDQYHHIDPERLRLPIAQIMDSTGGQVRNPGGRKTITHVTADPRRDSKYIMANSGLIGPATLGNDSMFGDSEMGPGYTDRNNRLGMIRKKLEDIVMFCEEIVKKLSQELTQKQEERNQITKIMQRATVNIPKTALEDQESGKESLVFIFHKDWNLVINIMIGINKAIRALWDLEQHTLTPADYKMKDMFELAYHRSLGGDLSSKQTISFICYAPYVFADIRRLYGIDDEAFLNSIGSDALIGNLIRGEVKAFRELFSTGQSGSFFYYSVDGNYVIKTLRSDEYRFFKSILVDYHQHLKNHTKSLMPKFFGMYEILSVPKNGCCSRACCGKGIFSCAATRIFLVVMENIFGTEMKIDKRFDLKGSTYKRTVGPEKLKGKHKSMIALKDMDFLASDSKIKLAKGRVDGILETVKQDCLFFERMNIIDYSLLLGVHSGQAGPAPPAKKEWAYFVQEQSAADDEVYFFGIIDILTSFSQLRKKLEFCVKRACLGPGISCIPAAQYSLRFQAFLKDVVFHPVDPVVSLSGPPLSRDLSPGLPPLPSLPQPQKSHSNPSSRTPASILKPPPQPH